MTAARAIDRRAVPMVRRRARPGDFDDGGSYVPGLSVDATIKGVVQPASGNQLKDVPEGLRTEANWVLWTREDVQLDDRIISGSIMYRILYLWPRDDGGFNRAALGRETQ